MVMVLLKVTALSSHTADSSHRGLLTSCLWRWAASAFFCASWAALRLVWACMAWKWAFLACFRASRVLSWWSCGVQLGMRMLSMYGVPKGNQHVSAACIARVVKPHRVPKKLTVLPF